jgi:nucleolar protein 12
MPTCNQPFHGSQVEGNHIRVDRAAKPAGAAKAAGSTAAAAAGGDAAGQGSGTLYEPSRSVFIGNVDFNVSFWDAGLWR